MAEPRGLPEEQAANLLHELVLTVLRFHHPLADERAAEVKAVARSLGLAVSEHPFADVFTRFDRLARRLRAHMHEEEETLLERVQLFMAKRQLTFGSLHASRHRIDQLADEHELDRLKDELVESLRGAQRFEGVAEISRVVFAIESYLRALAQHTRFEDEALVPVLRMFAAPSDAASVAQITRTGSTG